MKKIKKKVNDYSIKALILGSFIMMFFCLSNLNLAKAEILSNSISIESKQPEKIKPVETLNPIIEQNKAKNPSPVYAINHKPQNKVNLIQFMDIYALSSYSHYLFIEPNLMKNSPVPAYNSPFIQESFALNIPKEDLEKIFLWQNIIEQASKTYKLNPALLIAIMKIESNFSPFAISPKGAEGIMQIMPQTQEYLGLADPYDPEASIMAASAYLREQLDRFGTEELALAAYNAGPYNVMRYQSIPPFLETQKYINQVLNYKNKIEMK